MREFDKGRSAERNRQAFGGGGTGRPLADLLGVPRWLVPVGAILAVAAGIALFLLSAGLILILAPIALGAGLYARWRIGRALRRAEEAARAGTIDAEYRIIEIRRDE